VTAVREHHCGAWVYELTGPHGPLILDAAAVPGGPWEPHHDGRRAVPAPLDPQAWGHAEHSCVPDGQGELL
jgi:hypothetical protein